jgi:hypothetical protein
MRICHPPTRMKSFGRRFAGREVKPESGNACRKLLRNRGLNHITLANQSSLTLSTECHLNVRSFTCCTMHVRLFAALLLEANSNFMKIQSVKG